MLTEAERYGEQGPDKPFLDVWFENDKVGYVVGGYNLIFANRRRRQDLGALVRPHRQPELLNLDAIRPAAGGLYMTGEGGLVLKLDATAKRFARYRWTTKGASSAWPTPVTRC